MNFLAMCYVSYGTTWRRFTSGTYHTQIISYMFWWNDHVPYLILHPVRCRKSPQYVLGENWLITPTQTHTTHTVYLIMYKNVGDVSCFVAVRFSVDSCNPFSHLFKGCFSWSGTSRRSIILVSNWILVPGWPPFDPLKVFVVKDMFLFRYVL